MASSLVRGKYVIAKVQDRHTAVIIEDGAVFQNDGVIVDVGPYSSLAAKYRPDATLGSTRHVVLPGFINSHHHTGLLAFQLGSPDLPLELWIASRFRKRDVDPYLDTLYSAFEMIESGITTVQHLHSRASGSVEQVQRAANTVIRAYQDIGMRVSYSYGLRDQNSLVYAPDEAFLRRLPTDLANDLGDRLSRQMLSLQDNFVLFEELCREHRQARRVKVQLMMSNLQWCSDKALERLRDCVDRHQVPVHSHLLETKYQKEYARRRGGGSAITYLHQRGLLGPHVTLGHGVWMTESDVELVASTGTLVCHNASSNLRLRSGVAPVNFLEQRGVRVAIGLDDASINDDRNMLHEMRLVMRLHREPGMGDDVPTAPQVLRMATEYGAQTTPYGVSIGTLEPGKAADLVIMDWEHIAYPYLDDEVPVVDALVHLARTSGVETVLVDGEPILLDRKFTRVNKHAAMEEFAASLRAPLRPEELARRQLARRLLPHVKAFYADEGYLGARSQASHPFYEMNCRH